MGFVALISSQPELEDIDIRRQKQKKGQEVIRSKGFVSIERKLGKLKSLKFEAEAIKDNPCYFLNICKIKSLRELETKKSTT